VTVGARDIANGTVEVYRRDLDTKEVVKIDELADYCEQTLAEIQS
jgi:prolyl-tRNA synthetase